MRPLVVGLALLLAGCLGPPAPPQDPEPDRPTPQVDIIDDRPEPTFGNVTTGPSVGPDLNATLAAPPRLVPGEWWRIRFNSPLDGRSAEYVRVIAAVQDGDYVVGMPHEGWYKEAVIYHAPAFGDVAGDLSYETHDNVFVPVKFPLTEDQTWTTSFSGSPELTARVTVLSPYEAQVNFTFTTQGGPLPGQEPQTVEPLSLIYDARLHEVREFRQTTVHYEVVDHGYDFQGWITIPRAEDLIFFHGRGLGVVGIAAGGGQPAPPLESLEISGGYNRVTFIQAVGGFFGPQPGVYRVLARAPDGTEYVTESDDPAGTSRVEFFEHAEPDGTWELEFTALGQGVAFIEGIAYHQYDIHLPTGGRRADHSHEVIR